MIFSGLEILRISGPVFYMALHFYFILSIILNPASYHISKV